MTTKASDPARKPVDVKMINESIKMGHFAKATKLVKVFDLMSNEEKKNLLADIKVLWDKQKASLNKDAAKPKAPAKPVKKKAASVDTIVEKYQALISEIAEFEVDRRAQKKHANFYTRHRRQVEVMARNFEKFGRR